MSGRRKNKSRREKKINPRTCSKKDVRHILTAPFMKLVAFLKKHWVVLLTIIGVFIAILTLILYLRDKKRNAMSGVLDTSRLAQVRYLSVGATRFRIDSTDGVFLRDGNLPVLSVNLKENRLMVSTSIRDSEGQLIAELVNNEWELNRNSIFDRNYTDNALEVRDNRGNIALQVIHFGDTIHLAGIFRCRNGRTNVLGPIGEAGAVMDIKPPGQEPEYLIPAIFEYPSELHFGSCPGLHSVQRLIKHGPGPAYRLGGSLDICRQSQEDE